MNRINLQLSKRIRAALLPAALVLLIGGIGGPMMVFPAFRLAENTEHLPAKERSEEPAAFGRIDQHRHLRMHHSPLAIAVILPAWRPLGHAQHLVLDAPAGHRLPNGLLAPLTC